MIKVKVRFFGVLRKVFDSSSPVATLEVVPGTTVNEFKTILMDWLEQNEKSPEDPQIILDSAIGNEDEILTGETRLNESTQLVVLPPVCGG